MWLNHKARKAAGTFGSRFGDPDSTDKEPIAQKWPGVADNQEVWRSMLTEKAVEDFEDSDEESNSDSDDEAAENCTKLLLEDELLDDGESDSDFEP